MTLQDLRDVLGEALGDAYTHRDSLDHGFAEREFERAKGHVELLTFLIEGVRRTMEKRSTEVVAMAESANEVRSVHDFVPEDRYIAHRHNLCKVCNLTFVKGNHYEWFAT